MNSDLKNILLVEDNPNDAELTLEALSEHHLANRVKWVMDGEEALDYLLRRGTYQQRATYDPVLILLDLKLPKVDGLDVLKTIKQHPVLQTIPVVILTSSREESDLLAGYRLGVNAYVVKPVEFDAFVKAVKELGVFWALINEQPPVKTV